MTRTDCIQFLIVLLISAITAVNRIDAKNRTYNNSRHRNIHKGVKEKIQQRIEIHNSDIDEWLIEVLRYKLDAIHTVEEIYKQLKLLSASPYGHAKLQNLTVRNVKARFTATTAEGNYIPYINISVGSFIRKPAIIIVAGIHGCDWLGVAAAMNLVHQLIVNYYKNYYYTNLVTWIIVPILNPDGYNATLSDATMRNWRKNMFKSPKANSSSNGHCFGVNLCKNFEYQWINYDYTNASWCDEQYADLPFSQNESVALRDTIRDHLDTIVMFVSLKQRQRALTYPFSYTHQKPMFWQVYENIVRAAAKVASEQHGRYFNYGHVLKFKKRYAGDVDDWIKAHLGVLSSFTFAVSSWRDNQKRLSHTEIAQTNDETFVALKKIAIMGIAFDERKHLQWLENFSDCKRTVNTSVFVISTLLVTLLSSLRS